MINIQFKDLKALVTDHLFNCYYNKLVNSDKSSVLHLAQFLFYIIIKVMNKKIVKTIAVNQFFWLMCYFTF